LMLPHVFQCQALRPTTFMHARKIQIFVEMVR
jgi:hypothetical protein